MSKAQQPLQTLPAEMEPLWDENSDKYKCCCRSVHVKSGTLYIGYAQLIVTLLFVGVFGYYYVQLTNGNLGVDHWIAHYGEKYISSLMVAVLLQLVIVTLLLHGAKMERRSFLLPFIVFATIGVFLGFVQLMTDINLLLKQARGSYELGEGGWGDNQLLSHLFGTMVHAWCVGVVWRFYTFLGDKKVAESIGAQLHATQTAFHYGDIPHGYMFMPEPPPYADTVISDKHPLTASA